MSATLTRTPQSCTHPRARHQHGTRECYEYDRCGCPPCRAANARYARRRRKLAQWGRTPGGLVDAGPVREHVQRLTAAGIGQHEVAARAGLSTTVVYTLLHGRPGKPPSVRVAASTAARLLAVPVPDVDQLAAAANIDGTGTRRRLQALVALGWTQRTLAAELGITPPNLGRVLHGYGKGLVHVRTRRAVVQLYNRLSMCPPARPDEAALRAAARHRWAPPLAWDDDTIDDPAATPNRGWKSRREDGQAFDEIAIERAMHGDPVHLRPVERAEAVRRLTARGLSAKEIAALLGVAPRSATRIRTGHGEAA